MRAAVLLAAVPAARTPVALPLSVSAVYAGLYMPGCTLSHVLSFSELFITPNHLPEDGAVQARHPGTMA